MGRDIIPVACYGYYVPMANWTIGDEERNALTDLHTIGASPENELNDMFGELLNKHRCEIVEMGRCEYPQLFIAASDSVVWAKGKFCAEMPLYGTIPESWTNSVKVFLYELNLVAYSLHKTTTEYLIATAKLRLLLETEEPQIHFGFYDSY